MSVPSEEQVKDLASRLVAYYCELGDKARLNKGALAAIAGVSRTQFAKYTHPEGAVSIGLYPFVRIKAACTTIQQGLDEGWLPASGQKGKPQDDAVERITGGQ